MKKHFRYLTSLPFLLIMILGTALSSASQSTAVRDIDPACQSSCFQELQVCVFAATRNSEENHCFAQYRHCIAQCGKH